MLNFFFCDGEYLDVLVEFGQGRAQFFFWQQFFHDVMGGGKAV